MTTISEELALFITETTYNSLPSETVAEVKLRVLDTLGALIIGSTTSVGTMLAALGSDQTGEIGQATAIPQGRKLSLLSAVLINSALAHCAEIDDIHPIGVVCTGAMVVPAALAMAEAKGCSGQELISAIVVGYEVVTRCAIAVQGDKLLAKGWWPSTTMGPLGTAAAAAKVSNFSPQLNKDALGIAGILAGGLLTGGAEGSTGKHFLFGRAAQNGVEAATLAYRGFTGPSRIFEDERGLFASRGVGLHRERLLEGLGRSYLFPTTGIKAYTCALQMQAAVSALLILMKENGLKAKNIKAIKVKLPPKSLVTVRSGIPVNLIAAAASAPYLLAVAAFNGTITLEQFRQEKLDDKGVQNLMRVVEVEADHNLDIGDASWPALVEIKDEEANTYRREVREWVEKERSTKRSFIHDKFRRLTETVLDHATAERIIESVENMEEGGVQAILKSINT